MATALAELQYQIGDGILFGRGTNIHVAKFDPQAPNIRSADQDAVRSDGTVFGRDWRSGRLCVFDINVVVPGASALDTLEALTAAWAADDVRTVPGAVTTLRFRRGDRTRVVFGRPRKFAANTERAVTQGWSPVTADFQAVDHMFYDDLERTNTVSIVPSSTGGLSEPLVDPLGSTEAATTAQPGGIDVEGSAPCCPSFTVFGPVDQPAIVAIDEWQLNLNLTLAYDEFVTISTVPWARFVRRNGIANAAGAITTDSPRLASLTLNPGPHNIILHGDDPTGTASMSVSWRPAYYSF